MQFDNFPEEVALESESFRAEAYNLKRKKNM